MGRKKGQGDVPPELRSLLDKAKRNPCIDQDELFKECQKIATSMGLKGKLRRHFLLSLFDKRRWDYFCETREAGNVILDHAHRGQIVLDSSSRGGAARAAKYDWDTIQREAEKLWEKDHNLSKMSVAENIRRRLGKDKIDFPSTSQIRQRIKKTSK